MNQYQITNRALKLQHLLIPTARTDLRTNPTKETFIRYTSLVEELELYKGLSEHPNLLEPRANHTVHLSLEHLRQSGTWEGFRNDWREK
jgi:hypothetical protein